MNKIEFAKDLEYFTEMYEHRRSTGENRHTPEAWDNRAESWDLELNSDTPFRGETQQRVEGVAEFLRKEGLLKDSQEIIDIGCGPGRFVAEFAKTAKHVTGLDLSPKMAELGSEYAKKQGLTNTTFISGDFYKLDPEKEGLKGKYDLVFTSMMPAVGTKASLEKMMEMSKSYCFNACPISGSNSIETSIANNVFQLETSPRPMWDKRWFYSLFNLLWLEGYLPETKFHTVTVDTMVKVNEQLAKDYVMPFSSLELTKEEIYNKIYSYLTSIMDSNGEIKQVSQRGYGWVLWHV